MKKLIAFILFYCFISVLNANAAIVNNMAEGEFQEYINKIGFRLLNYNEIEHHIIFRYSDKNKLYGYTNYDDMTVTVPKGVLYNVESEDELAAVIAHQTAYCLIYKDNKFSKMNIKFSPKKYEVFADKIAADMLVKAKYSPVSLITVINKTYGDKKDRLFSKHVKTSVRLANIYEHIVRKYPLELEKSSFKNNLYYQNFLLTSRKNRETLQNKLHKNQTNQTKYEYR